MYIKYDMDISLIGIIKRGKVSTWQGSMLVSNTKNKVNVRIEYNL